VVGCRKKKNSETEKIENQRNQQSIKNESFLKQYRERVYKEDIRMMPKKSDFDKTATGKMLYQKQLKAYHQELSNTTKTEKERTKHLETQSQATERLGGRTSGLLRVFSRMRNQLLVMTFALTGVVMAVKRMITELTAYENALRGLETVALAFGQDTFMAKTAAQSLAKDGLMTVSEAAEGLKNLLGTGFSLPEAINLMNAFKDAAAFNRQGTLEYGEAIIGATQGLKNQMSQLVDNVGITKKSFRYFKRSRILYV
jgi:hypothetical protein